MMKLLPLALIAAPAFAQDGEHKMQKLYSERPCTEVIGAIDAPIPDSDTNSAITAIAQQGMAWGYLLAHEDMIPDASGDSETLLQRLRKDCAANHKTPALELLKGY